MRAATWRGSLLVRGQRGAAAALQAAQPCAHPQAFRAASALSCHPCGPRHACLAGIMSPPKRLVTSDGLEMQFQVGKPPPASRRSMLRCLPTHKQGAAHTIDPLRSRRLPCHSHSAHGVVCAHHPLLRPPSAPGLVPGSVVRAPRLMTFAPLCPSSLLWPLPPCPLPLQVNFLSHFLLSHELLAEQRQRRRRTQQRARGQVRGRALSEGPPSGTRLVLLSSLTHYAGPVQWEDKQVRRWARHRHASARSHVPQHLASGRAPCHPRRPRLPMHWFQTCPIQLCGRRLAP
jgi:hypothetical protein